MKKLVIALSLLVSISLSAQTAYIDVNNNFTTGQTINGNIVATGKVVADRIDIDNRRAIDFNNNWLYINPSNDFTSGVYVGSQLKVNNDIMSYGFQNTKISNSNGYIYMN